MIINVMSYGIKYPNKRNIPIFLCGGSDKEPFVVQHADIAYNYSYEDGKHLVPDKFRMLRSRCVILNTDACPNLSTTLGHNININNVKVGTLSFQINPMVIAYGQGAKFECLRLDCGGVYNEYGKGILEFLESVEECINQWVRGKYAL